MRALKTTFWCILFAASVYAEFGLVYVILSCLYFIFTNLGSEVRKPGNFVVSLKCKIYTLKQTKLLHLGQASAYSVFNKNGAQIAGSLVKQQNDLAQLKA
jgi:hypothetical protein